MLILDICGNYILFGSGFIDFWKNTRKVSFIKKILYFVSKFFLGVSIYRKQEIYGNEDPNNYLLLWGEYFVLDPNRINTFFIGNPAFDNLFKSFSGVRTLKKNIVICTQNLDDLFSKKLYLQITNLYIQVIKNRPDLFFFIKVHPREPIEKYKKIFDENELTNIEIIKDCNLHDLFQKCDIQISVTSYTILEAAVMGLPVISISHPVIKKSFLDHFRGEIDIPVSSTNEMLEAIITVRSEEYWEKFIKKRDKYFKKMMYSTDGNSGKRAAKIIKKLIKLNLNKKTHH